LQTARLTDDSSEDYDQATILACFAPFAELMHTLPCSQPTIELPSDVQREGGEIRFGLSRMTDRFQKTIAMEAPSLSPLGSSR